MQVLMLFPRNGIVTSECMQISNKCYTLSIGGSNAWLYMYSFVAEVRFQGDRCAHCYVSHVRRARIPSIVASRV